MSTILEDLAELADALDKMGKGGEWWSNNAGQTWTIVPLKAWAKVIRTHHATIAQNAEAAKLVDTLKLEVKIHAQEARTANATIAEIYQLCTGSTGEPGNWNGADPVRKMAEDSKRLKALEQAMTEVNSFSVRYAKKRADEIMRGEG